MTTLEHFALNVHGQQPHHNRRSHYLNNHSRAQHLHKNRVYRTSDLPRGRQPHVNMKGSSSSVAASSSYSFSSTSRSNSVYSHSSMSGSSISLYDIEDEVEVEESVENKSKSKLRALAKKLRRILIKS
ncbi:hypothetical protein BG005_008526 [Podila minutissima]|nr:hypothetical protein BG005_008526 [Podila minutissima]